MEATLCKCVCEVTLLKMFCFLHFNASKKAKGNREKGNENSFFKISKHYQVIID